MSNVRLDLSGLQELKNRLKATNKKARVGILGGDNSRPDEPLGNAGIGLVHEMGSTTKNIPPRSFLRMPLETKAKELVSVLDSKLVSDNISQGNLEVALELLGIKAEAIVQEAFESGGFGKWAANSPDTIAQKGSASPLIDTGELRKSISSKVV